MEETEYSNSWNGSRGGNRGGKNRGGNKRNRGRFFGQGNSGNFDSRSQNMEAGGSNGGNFDFNRGFYDRSSQFGEMMYPGNMNQMQRNQWEVSYPINTRYMGYRPENQDYSYFGPYNNPSNDYGGYRGMNTNFDYSNRFSDGYDMSQDYGYNADFGFNNYNDGFHMPSRPGGGPFHSRRGNFPHRGRGRGRFSRSPKQFHANRQGKKKKKKSQDSAAPKHVFAKKPWFDDAILKLLKEKIKAHKRMKRSPSKSNIEAFKELRKEVRRISRQSYNDYCLKSGLPNKYLEAAKAKRQKAEEAASKADNGNDTVATNEGEENGNTSNCIIDQNENSVTERKENGDSSNIIDQNENCTNEREENENNDNILIDQNENAVNERSEDDETKISESINNINQDKNDNRPEEENVDTIKEDGQNIQNINDRLETEFINGNEELNQNTNNSLGSYEEKTSLEVNTEQLMNIRPNIESEFENENSTGMKEQIITRQTVDTDSLDVKVDNNNMNTSPEENFVGESTTYETSESIVS